jgi:hypothetical protein
MVINAIAINTNQKGKKLLIKFGIENLGFSVLNVNVVAFSNS